MRRRTFRCRIVRLVGPALQSLAYIGPVDGVPRAFAGWRVLEMLAVGKHLYVDDLITDASLRSRGYGRQLLDWLKTQARHLGCARLQLDSGTQRKDAHAFYLREGLRIESFHFGIVLD